MFGPSLAELCPTVAKCGSSSPDDDIGPHLAQIGPNLAAGTRLPLAEIGPDSVGIRTNVADFGPDPAEFGTSLADFGPNLVDCGPIPVQFWPTSANFGRARSAESAKHDQHLVGIWLKHLRSRSNLTHPPARAHPKPFSRILLRKQFASSKALRNSSSPQSLSNLVAHLSVCVGGRHELRARIW